jgi:hypothetical protein
LVVQFIALSFYACSYMPYGQGVMKKLCMTTVGVAGRKVGLPI